MSITLFPGIPRVNRGELRRSLLSGVSLASMDIPQVLGYSRIAEMPVVTGLYTLLLPLVAFALFGSSRHLVVAADSATAAIFASSLSEMAAPGSPKYAALVGAVALLTAGLLLLARVFRLGFIADFLSRTVLAGFLVGVGIQVAVAVLGELLGVPVTAHGVVGQLRQILQLHEDIHLPTACVAAVVVLVIVVCKRWAPRFPAPLFLMVAGVVASYVFDFAGQGIAVIGALPSGLPSLSLPWVTLQEIVEIVPVAVSCFVVIIAQSAATARAYAARYGERVDEDADIVGLSAANAAAAMSGAFVVNGSLTQTAMADRAGVRSQLAHLFAAAAVGLVLLFLTGPLQHLPRAVLAGLVFTIALGLADPRGLLAFRRESPGEFKLALVTMAAVAFVGVEEGIVLAMALSLLRHVRHSYRPHTMVLVPDPAGGLLAVDAKPGIETGPGLIVYRFGADLFYANEARFADEVSALVRRASSPVRWLVVDAAAITDVDYSAARMLLELRASLRQQGVELVFARVVDPLLADMERHGLVAALGRQRIFRSLHEALAAIRGGALPPAAHGH